MQPYTIELLNKLMDITQKHPEKWITTSLKSGFEFKNKPSISISKLFDRENQETIEISSMDKMGHIIYMVTITEKEDPELYQAYLAFYDQVRDLAIGNNYMGIKAAALACA
jgi:hypothetical protein